jgi:hypothetical protein
MNYPLKTKEDVMSKAIFLGLILGLILGIAPTGIAQDMIIGYVLVEYYDNIGGSTIESLVNSNIFPSEATEMLWLESFEIPTNRAENYGTRVGGYLIPPETGEYTFWIASDDASELWLSPDDTYEAAVKIASVPGWARPRQWDKDPNQQSVPIELVAGQKYYIEALHKEGGSGDNLAVGWTGPGIGDDIVVIDGQYLSPYLMGEDDPLIAQYYKARIPVPADGGLAGSTEPTLSWEPIIYAESYNVYLSTDENVVVEGTALAGQVTANQYTAIGLTTNTSYYWRVDGIGSDGTVYQGKVWSFTVTSLSASLPSPADGVLFVDPNIDLSWTAGLGAVEHHLYFGGNADDVVSGTNDTDKGLLQTTSYELDTLERGATYYWRVDEFDSVETYPGPLWQFQVEYDVPLSDDPNLIGWWKMEEGATGRVVDWSGHGNDGTIQGNPQWIPGEDGMALDFDGDGDYITTGRLPSELGVGGNAPRTVTTWMFIRSFNSAAPYEMGSHSTAEDFSLTARSLNNWRLQYWKADLDFDMEALNEWVHITHTHDGTETRIYANGQLVVTHPVTLNTTDGKAFTIGQYRSYQFDGILDDVRLYNKAVTAEDIPQIMRGNLLRAWAPNPGRNVDVDIEHATTISFNPGDNAVLHDIYFGAAPLAVEEALADANVSPEYQGRQAETKLDINDMVRMGNTYYWRVDEIDSDGALTKGRVWNFNVTDYLIIDDFEVYDNNHPVYETWQDGYNVNTGNGTGGIVGNLNFPFMETNIVNSGEQAVPFSYNNSGTTRAAYSEISLEFETSQDFTRLGITNLQLSFYGRATNTQDRLYVALEDAGGQVAEVAHPDGGALLVEEWQDWNIALSDFKAINLQAIKIIYIGVGNRSNPIQSGSGTLILDDILLTTTH